MSVQMLLFEIETVPISMFWVFFVIFGIGGFFLVRLHPLFIVPTLLIIFLFYLTQAVEIHSDLEPGIIKQEGESYIIRLLLAGFNRSDIPLGVRGSCLYQALG